MRPVDILTEVSSLLPMFLLITITSWDFEFMHRFFDRLFIIDQKMPNIRPFQSCVTRVFSSILKICSVAQRYAVQKRLSEFYTAHVDARDS
jgi:hypothetical protein